ncbi:MAG: 1-acyl-sn-glycerol-3-phosphate acyltransferase [Propionibacteriaceae bacterium]|nr:1-acyl-sn-glycerol-3-phosphate acyltransferase [Propionibacteriaceae bacterium]
MKRGQTVVVRDERHDDFGSASKRFTKVHLADDEYVYVHRNFWWRLVAAFLYYILVPPVAVVLALFHGVLIHNRRAVRRTGGCYLYGNHTHWMDVFIPFLLSFPRRAYVVAGPTAISVPFVRHLVPMLGCVPLNVTPAGKDSFRKALDRAVARGSVVAIFPESHEWPYFNGIRDFTPYSFTYPVRTHRPALGYVVTYRRRLFLRWRPPHMTVTVGQPIMPDEWAGAADPKQLIRDRVHTFMCDTVRQKKSYAWVRYELTDKLDQPPA